MNLQSTDNGYTPLHEACAGQHHEIVRILLEDERTDPTISAKGGRSVIHVAAHVCSTEIVGILLADSRVDPNANAGFADHQWEELDDGHAKHKSTHHERKLNIERNLKARYAFTGGQIDNNQSARSKQLF